MSNLTQLEKLKLERLFEMGSGYVMLFSNSSFQNFVLEVSHIDIYDEKYSYLSGSKANRLRAFWEKENNCTVSKVTFKMLELWRANKKIFLDEILETEQDLFEECEKIAARLAKDVIVEDVEVFREDEESRDFSLLAKSISDSIENNQPEVALDRLHTYVTKFTRHLCEKHNMTTNKDESLNGIFGKYVKFIVGKGKIESQMAERILKYSIHVLEAFNDIRNNKSFAHDNPILNYDESVLIFNNITNTIKFVELIEAKINKDVKHEESKVEDLNNLPF